MKLGEPEPCTERYLVNNYIRLGQLPYVTGAVSSPLSSRSGRQLARSGSSAEDVLALSWWFEQGRDHQVAR